MITILQIESFKADRESLIAPLKEAYKIREAAYQAFAQAHNTWLKLSKQFESLDREIALFEHSQKPVHNTTKVQKTPKEQAENAARKALEALPADIREQLLKTFTK